MMFGLLGEERPSALPIRQPEALEKVTARHPGHGMCCIMSLSSLPP